MEGLKTPGPCLATSLETSVKVVQHGRSSYTTTQCCDLFCNYDTRIQGFLTGRLFITVLQSSVII